MHIHNADFVRTSGDILPINHGCVTVMAITEIMAHIQNHGIILQLMKNK